MSENTNTPITDDLVLKVAKALYWRAAENAPWEYASTQVRDVYCQDARAALIAAGHTYPETSPEEATTAHGRDAGEREVGKPLEPAVGYCDDMTRLLVEAAFNAGRKIAQGDSTDKIATRVTVYVLDCPDCFGSGLVEDQDGNPTGQKCYHPKRGY